MEIAGLNVQREITIYARLDGPIVFVNAREQFRRPPIPHFKIPCLAEASANLMVEAPHAEYVRHLDQSISSRA